MKTCILEKLGVKQEANTSFKEFLTEPRGNFFISSSYWDEQGVIFLFMIFLADTRGKFLVIKVSCVRQGVISLILGGYWSGQGVIFVLEGQ